ncbi:MAG TPA: twin-arginine translocation signal domain-containing protein, partial [Euryarchaeota archaeon]|nr:twin-arginine translocation signal domain-containing protein [Euryarchaeota archaeon]
MLRMKRRSFLKLAAATGAAATIAPRLASAKIEYPDYP